ncbi:MAG TPA: hypothetical protein VJN43_12465 [Bryobacteraceae bacterium]|nr:hypothetical protein [Bryobacteraceae bacterium]
MVRETIEKAKGHVLVADEAWIALATLHKKYPQRPSFSAKEILDQVKRQHVHPEVRAGVQAHIYLHNVANLEPNSARYRMFYRLENETYRLFRNGDRVHPLRRGKVAPNRAQLPEKYHPLLDWYENEYCKGEGNAMKEQDDPILQMWGLGKEIWAGTNADEYVNSLRSGWEDEEKIASAIPEMDVIWRRIGQHQGEEFRTSRGLLFTYQVEGKGGIWFYRNGERVNQRFGRGDVEKAVQKCPLEKTSDINECRDYAYLFGVLMDPRIRGRNW